MFLEANQTNSGLFILLGINLLIEVCGVSLCGDS